MSRLFCCQKEEWDWTCFRKLAHLFFAPSCWFFKYQKHKFKQIFVSVCIHVQIPFWINSDLFIVSSDFYIYMLKHFVLNNLCKEILISTFSQKSTYLIRCLETATQLRNWLWASKTVFISKPLTLELIVTVSFARFDVLYWRPTVPRPNYNLSSHFYSNSMLLATCQRDLNTTCYAKLIGRLEASAESTLEKIWLFVPLTWRKLIPNKSHLGVCALTQLTGVTWPRSNMQRLAKPKQNGKPQKKASVRVCLCTPPSLSQEGFPSTLHKYKVAVAPSLIPLFWDIDWISFPPACRASEDVRRSIVPLLL